MSIKISNSELEIMRILWREKQPLSFTFIREELEKKKTWNKSTIYTLILRLRDKGILRAEAQDVMMFSPIVTEEEYYQHEEQKFLDRLLDGSTKNILTALLQNKQLDDKTIAELKAYIETEDDEK